MNRICVTRPGTAYSPLYETAPILKRDVPPHLRTVRLWFVALTRETLSDALATLGFPALD